MRKGAQLGLVILALAAAWTPVSQAGAAEGVSGTKHDFMSTGTGTIKDTGTTATLCNTCHYPHNTGSAALVWNHTLSSNTMTFGTGASTVAGTVLPTNIATAPAPGTSKYCLSCHDGTVAVGDFIKGTDWGTTKVTGNFVIGTVTGTETSLSGNHPVEVPYGDGSTYNSITSKADIATFQAAPTGVKLFGAASAKGIGCASCHNPHDATISKFLRVAATSLCTSCHKK